MHIWREGPMAAPEAAPIAVGRRPHPSNRFADRTGSYPDDEDATSETRYQVHLNRFWEGSMMEQVFGLQFNGTGAVYETGLDETQYWLNNNLGARYRHTFSSFHQVEAWLRFYQLS
jgi:hypothetical protein